MQKANSLSNSKPPTDSCQAIVQSFIRRNNSMSPINPIKPDNSYASSMSRLRSSEISKANCEYIFNGLTKSSSKADFSKIFNKQSPELNTFLAELKEKLEKVEALSNTIKVWREKLEIKEKELETWENTLKEQEQAQEETERRLLERQRKIEFKEKELKNKEIFLANKKKNMIIEINAGLEKKILDIAEKERSLLIASNQINKQMKELRNKKEENIIMECSVVLNELIGSIILSDYQNRVLESRVDMKSQSFEEFSISDTYSSLYDIERIDEVSNESSNSEETENFSFPFPKANIEILEGCSKITENNQDVSNKLEALIASLTLPNT